MDKVVPTTARYVGGYVYPLVKQGPKKQYEGEARWWHCLFDIFVLFVASLRC